jgi:hypothetical protein
MARNRFTIGVRYLLNEQVYLIKQLLQNDQVLAACFFRFLRVPDDSGTTFSGQPPVQVGSSCFGTDAT